MVIVVIKTIGQRSWRWWSSALWWRLQEREPGVMPCWESSQPQLSLRHHHHRVHRYHHCQHPCMHHHHHHFCHLHICLAMIIVVVVCVEKIFTIIVWITIIILSYCPIRCYSNNHCMNHRHQHKEKDFIKEEWKIPIPPTENQKWCYPNPTPHSSIEGARAKLGWMRTVSIISPFGILLRAFDIIKLFIFDRNMEEGMRMESFSFWSMTKYSVTESIESLLCLLESNQFYFPPILPLSTENI